MTKQGLAMQRHPSTAVPVPRFLSRSSLWRRFSAFCGRHLNFYRVHLLWFTFVPLIASAIFYASNGPSTENKIAYIDCLYMCVSAICVTGLTTALFVNLTVWQEVILGFLMLIGGISFVSIIVLGIRRQFFKNKFDYLVRHDAEARERVNEVGAAEAAREGREYKAFDAAHGPKRFPFFGSRRNSRWSAATQTESARGTQSGTVDGDRTLTAGQNRRYERRRDGRVRPDMIRRVDDPVRVNEMSNAGWLGGEPLSAEPEGLSSERRRPREASAGSVEEGGEIAREEPALSDGNAGDMPAGILQSGGEGPSRGVVQIESQPHVARHTTGRQELAVDRTRTIEFRETNEPDFRRRANRTQPAHEMQFTSARRRPSRSSMQDHELGLRTLTRTTTIDQTAMESGFGGFPNPLRAAAALAKEKIPYVRNTFGGDGAMPRTTTMISTHSHADTTLAGAQYDRNGSIKPVSYISFDALVGRNSRFHALTKAQQEELGGIEYRALTLLIKIVVCYWAGLQLFAITMLAPYLTYVGRWTTTIRDANPNANPTWFTFFQYISSYSNTGLSLVDASLVPFQQCYFLVFFQGMLILAGNTAYPVLLRFTIWMMSKIAPKRSQTRETLQFLLDHPRRCFIYLFPSHQTWFLVFLLVILNSIDWVAFEVLDIGTPQIEAIPVGTRIFDGLFQAVAVRSAGFAIVNLGAVAPALQLLYVIMMYIAVYPIAVSIRSTNVYEEKSMGVYDEDFDEDDDEVESRFRKSRSATGYIGYHARKQLAFDLWWLALAVWLICIIERGAINSGDLPEVNVFSVIFEVVSAYGNVGLSLGNNTNAASLSFTFSTLAKLIVIAVMIRGRHRGLPVAIDRAVLLPAELERHNDDITTRSSLETMEARARARRGSMASVARSMQDEPTSYVPERTISRSSSLDDARSQGGAGTIRARDIIREDKVPSAEADVSDEKVATDSTASDATSYTGEKRVEAGVEAHSMQNRDQVGWH